MCEKAKNEKIEELLLYKLAESRANEKTSSFAEFVAEQGFLMAELEELAQSVEIE